MKKLFALFLTLVLVLALSACDNKGGEVNKQNDNAVSKTQSQAEQSGDTQESANQQSQAAQPAESATEQGNTQNSQSASATPDKSQQSTSAVENTASDATQSAIGRDRAIELALNHAGLNKADVRDLEAELDRERGGTYWEVDFEYGGYDYSYDLNAQTGEIVIAEKEKD